MSEQEERMRVVAEARRWLGTPYHHRAHVLGAGCDCLYLLIEAFEGAGLVKNVDPGIYSKQWFLHRDEERYLEGLMGLTTELDLGGDTPITKRDVPPVLLPGDILMFRHGRTFSHSAIVTEWPFVIHASAPADLVEEVSLPAHDMARKPLRAYSYWGPR